MDDGALKGLLWAVAIWVVVALSVTWALASGYNPVLDDPEVAPFVGGYAVVPDSVVSYAGVGINFHDADSYHCSPLNPCERVSGPDVPAVPLPWSGILLIAALIALRKLT